MSVDTPGGGPADRMTPPTPYFERDGITIYNGDALEVLPQLALVDHVITDPPYGQDVYMRMRNEDSPGGNRRHAIKGGSALVAMKAGAIGSLGALVEGAGLEIGRLTRRWAVVFSDAESTHLWRAALTEGGLRYVRTGAWLKPDAMPQMTGDRPGVGFELSTIAHSSGRMKWNGGGHPAVWTHNIVKGDERPDHPCPKPIALMRELVSLFSERGEVILDPFMGSGTTLRAAYDLGRKAIGIEINEQYCEIAAKRLQQGVLL